MIDWPRVRKFSLARLGNMNNMGYFAANGGA
jgi:hypothetical protein